MRSRLWRNASDSRTCENRTDTSQSQPRQHWAPFQSACLPAYCSHASPQYAHRTSCTRADGRGRSARAGAAARGRGRGQEGRGGHLAGDEAHAGGGEVGRLPGRLREALELEQVCPQQLRHQDEVLLHRQYHRCPSMPESLSAPNIALHPKTRYLSCAQPRTGHSGRHRCGLSEYLKPCTAKLVGTAIPAASKNVSFSRRISR